MWQFECGLRVWSLLKWGAVQNACIKSIAHFTPHLPARIFHPMRTLALTARETLSIHNIAAPALHADEILVRNLACGVCGGDIKNFKAPRSEELSANGPFVVEGHEFTGYVAAMGAAVEGFEVGDRVVHVFNNYCGVCANCRVGNPNF